VFWGGSGAAVWTWGPLHFSRWFSSKIRVSGSEKHPGAGRPTWGANPKPPQGLGSRSLGAFGAADPSPWLHGVRKVELRVCKTLNPKPWLHGVRKVELAASDKLRAAKMAILEGLGLNSPQEFPLGADAFPVQLLSYLRLARIQARQQGGRCDACLRAWALRCPGATPLSLLPCILLQCDGAAFPRAGACARTRLERTGRCRAARHAEHETGDPIW
jgi:Rubisco LSMT substrate-binding